MDTVDDFRRWITPRCLLPRAFRQRAALHSNSMFATRSLAMWCLAVVEGPMGVAETYIHIRFGLLIQKMLPQRLPQHNHQSNEKKLEVARRGPLVTSWPCGV